MKECKRGKHKYWYQIKDNKYLLNKKLDFACMKCGLNWNFDETKKIQRFMTHTYGK